MSVTWNWQTDNSRINGFRYLWMKTVEGFNPSAHCARCLKGVYSKVFKPTMAVNTVIEEDYPEATILYFCGVSTPYSWKKNLHFVGQVKECAEVSIEAYTGDKIIISGVEEIPISDTSAKTRYSKKGKEFLTCRNFQLGAMLFQDMR